MFTPTLRLWDCKVQGYKLITLPTISLYDYGECEVSVVSSVQYSTVYSVQYSQWEQDPTLSVVLGSSGREDRRGVSAVPVNMLHSYYGSLLYNLETWQIHHHQQHQPGWHDGRLWQECEGPPGQHGGHQPGQHSSAHPRPQSQDQT